MEHDRFKLENGRRFPVAKAVHGSADEVFSVSGGRGIAIVLILFTICQFTLLIMNHMLFPGHPVSLESDRYSGGRHQAFTEAVLVVNGLPEQ